MAKAFSGEIINGDAMQIYQGLDILTNKQPLEERQDVRHHLLGYLNITDAYNVFQYEKEALYIVVIDMACRMSVINVDRAFA